MQLLFAGAQSQVVSRPLKHLTDVTRYLSLSFSHSHTRARAHARTHEVFCFVISCKMAVNNVVAGGATFSSHLQKKLT
jgi:hypothetical protein